jgi:hypothetical protein
MAATRSAGGMVQGSEKRDAALRRAAFAVACQRRARTFRVAN